MPSLGSIAATLLVAGLCGPALAPAAMAAELPTFRPGLWEFKRTVEGGRGPQTLANQKCTNPTEDMKKGRQSLAGVGCTFTPLTQSGSSYTFTADCLIQGVKRQSKSVITVASDSAYTVDVEAHQGGASTKEHLVARRIGDCPK